MVLVIVYGCKNNKKISHSSLNVIFFIQQAKQMCRLFLGKPQTTSLTFVPFIPQLGHILKGLTFCLWYKTPYKECCADTNQAVESIREPVSEIIAWL